MTSSSSSLSPLEALRERDAAIELLLKDDAEYDDEQQLARLLTERDQLLRQLADNPHLEQEPMQRFWREQFELNQRWHARAIELRDQAQQLLVKQRRSDKRLKAYEQ